MPSVGLRCSFESLPGNEETPPPSLRDVQIITPLHHRISTDPLGHYFEDGFAVRLARSLRPDFPGHIEAYLEGLNKWLPVVDDSVLTSRCGDPLAYQDEAFCALLLTCMLLSRVSRPRVLDEACIGNHELYLTITVSHASLLSKGVKSLDIVQSKILLAFYEHLQANHVAAVGSLSSAAAVAGAIGLFRWHCKADSGPIFVDIQGQREVCCLFVLER